MIICRWMVGLLSTNSTIDSRTTSAMTQPARRTFLPGHVVVIICSVTIQLSNIARTIHLEQLEQSYNKITSFAILGLLFLSYPLLGYIADVFLTRYRTLKCSFIFLIVGCTIAPLLIFVPSFVSIIEMLLKNHFTKAIIILYLLSLGYQ